MSRFLQNKDLFAVVSYVLSNIAILPKLIENDFAGWMRPAGRTFDAPDLKSKRGKQSFRHTTLRRRSYS